MNDKMREELPNIDYLRRIIRVDREGNFFWNSREVDDFSQERDANAWNARYAGKMAGSPRTPRKGLQSYWVIALQHNERLVHLYAHRLAIAMNLGYWPDGYVDHIDGDGLNNRLDNLRVVTSSISGMNKPLQKNNKTGIPGVSVDRRGAYRVQAGVSGRVIHLGYFWDLFSAACAKKSFEVRNGYHKNHGRSSIEAAGLKVKP